MRRIGAGDRTAKSIFRAVRVEPLPDLACSSVHSHDVDGAAMTIAAGCPASAMQRTAGARLEAGGDPLAVVVTERAEDRPLDAGSIHRPSGVIELLAEVGVHPADHVILQGHACALCRRRILPREVARSVFLDGLSLIDLPE